MKRLLLTISIAVVLGCAATATLLPWRDADTAAVMNSAAADQKWNTVRFVTAGPVTEQIYGYFLYGDGVEVRTGYPTVNLGKRSLKEVFADYSTINRERQYTRASIPLVREVLQEGKQVGYTVADNRMQIDTWDVGKKSGQPVLQVTYRDLRPGAYNNSQRPTPPGGD